MASPDASTTNGFVGMFGAYDETKILPYLEILRTSIYTQVTIELFENTVRCTAGSSYVNIMLGYLKFTAGSQTYQSDNMVAGAVTTYNNDCVFYADVAAGSPIFQISSNNGSSWTTIASGVQYIHSTTPAVVTSTYLVKIISTTSNDKVNSFGLVFGRKSKFRTVVFEEVS